MVDKARTIMIKALAKVEAAADAENEGDDEEDVARDGHSGEERPDVEIEAIERGEVHSSPETYQRNSRSDVEPEADAGLPSDGVPALRGKTIRRLARLYIWIRLQAPTRQFQATNRGNYHLWNHR